MHSKHQLSLNSQWTLCWILWIEETFHWNREHLFSDSVSRFFQVLQIFVEVLCVLQSIVKVLLRWFNSTLCFVIYKTASSLYRSYGSYRFFDVSVSINRFLTSSRNAFSDNSTVLISCSAIILFSKSVWIARCVVFFSNSRLIVSLLQCWLFGKIWWIEYWFSSFHILFLIKRQNESLDFLLQSLNDSVFVQNSKVYHTIQQNKIRIVKTTINNTIRFRLFLFFRSFVFWLDLIIFFVD